MAAAAMHFGPVLGSERPPSLPFSWTPRQLPPPVGSACRLVFAKDAAHAKLPMQSDGTEAGIKAMH